MLHDITWLPWDLDCSHCSRHYSRLCKFHCRIPLRYFFCHLFFQKVGNTEKRGIRAYLAASPPVYPHPIYLLLLVGNLVSICLIDCNTMDVFSARIAQGLLESTMPIGWKRNETLAACLRTFIFWWDLHSLRILKVAHCCCKVRSCFCMLCCWLFWWGAPISTLPPPLHPSWEEQPFFWAWNGCLALQKELLESSVSHLG